MGSNNKNSQFFRFCSPVNVFSSEFVGEPYNKELAIIDAIRFVDYDVESYIKESFLVMHYTKGGLNLKDLDIMPFDEFRIWIKEATRIQNMALNKTTLSDGQEDNTNE